MPRTEVYQLRLTPKEKADLAQLAREEGMSIAQMIRRRFGLSGDPRDDPVTTRQKAEVREAAAQGEYEVKVEAGTVKPKPKKPSPPAERPEPSGPTTEEIEAEARRIFYAEGQTMLVARRLARERLSAP